MTAASGSGLATAGNHPAIHRAGKADGTEYQPLHPEVQAAMKAKAVAAIATRAKHPNVRGLVVRLGPDAEAVEAQAAEQDRGPDRFRRSGQVAE